MWFNHVVRVLDERTFKIIYSSEAKWDKQRERPTKKKVEEGWKDDVRETLDHKVVSIHEGERSA